MSNFSIYVNAKTVTIRNTLAYCAKYVTHILSIDVFNKMSEEEKDTR